MDTIINNKESIQSALKEQIEGLVNWIANQKDAQFEFSLDGKWSTGQQLEHLIKSTGPVGFAMNMPKNVLEEKFGSGEYSNRNYTEVITAYKKLLKEGAQSTSKFVPEVVQVAQKSELLEGFGETGKALVITIEKWSEEELDKYQLPHPLLGKLTIREMLLFTVDHIQHHWNSLKANYSIV
ncbi:MAG: DinB family protein [Aureispira sp.]|nr:DinB family protein [Aureispira sp.]